jgi:hypothetical protein
MIRMTCLSASQTTLSTFLTDSDYHIDFSELSNHYTDHSSVNDVFVFSNDLDSSSVFDGVRVEEVSSTLNSNDTPSDSDIVILTPSSPHRTTPDLSGQCSVGYGASSSGIQTIAKPSKKTKWDENVVIFSSWPDEVVTPRK